MTQPVRPLRAQQHAESVSRDRSAPPASRDATGRRTGARAAVAGVLVAFAAVSAGCLPSGTRGGGSGLLGAGSGGSGGTPPVTVSTGPTGPTPRPSFVMPTPTPEPTFLVYVVARGDSLNTIAHRFGTTARSIAFWNRSTYPSLDPEAAGYRPNRLDVGWTLVLRPNDIVDEQNLPDASDSAGPSDPPSDAVTDDSAGAAMDDSAGAATDDPGAVPTDDGGDPTGATDPPSLDPDASGIPE